MWVGGPVPPGAAAITLGPLIIVRRGVPDRRGWDRLLHHELVHVEQWRRHGVAGFLLRYVGAYVWLRLRGWPHWASYRRLPLEVEAEWRSRTDPLA